MQLKKAIEQFNADPYADFDDIPRQLEPTEKLLEKFPPAEPLADAPYKGPTARKNKEVPTLKAINPNYEGIAFYAQGLRIFQYWRESDGRMFYSDICGIPEHREQADGLLRFQTLDPDDSDTRYLVSIAKDDDGHETITPIAHTSNVLRVEVPAPDFKNTLVGTFFDSLERETYKSDFLRTDIVFDNVRQRLKFGMQLRAVYNAASNHFQLFRNNTEVKKAKDIFLNADITKAFEQVFHPDKVDIYRMAYTELGALGNETAPNIGRALGRLRYLRVVETLHSAGFSTVSVKRIFHDMISVHRHNRYLSYSTAQVTTIRPTWRNILRFENTLKESLEDRRWRSANVIVNPLGTKPADILLLPKWLLKDTELRDKLLENSRYDVVVERLQRAVFRGDSTDIIREVTKMVMDHYDEDEAHYRPRTPQLIVEILDGIADGTVTNYQRLIRYLTFDVKFTQGMDSVMDAWQLLKDYYDMCHQMGIAPIRFPNSLKLSHDVAAFNQRKMNETENNEAFHDVMTRFEETADLSFSRKRKSNKETLTWEVVIPKTPKALIQEGNNLNHCVGSYVTNVVEERTTIIFLREFAGTEDAPKDGKSLLTIEVNPLTNGERTAYYIREVRGNSNRHPNEFEEQFIAEWGKKKPIYRTRDEAQKALNAKTWKWRHLEAV